MPSARIQLFGDKQLMRKLRVLPKKASRDAQRKALREASTPMMKTARRLVPVDEGNLKKSIGRKFKTYLVSNTVVVIIGPRIKTGKFSGQHGAIVEFGTVPRFHKSGKSVGAMPPHPFMRPAFDQHKVSAMQIMRRRIGEEIVKAMKVSA